MVEGGAGTGTATGTSAGGVTTVVVRRSQALRAATVAINAATGISFFIYLSPCGVE